MLVLSEQGERQRIEVLEFSPSGDALLAAGNGSWLDVWRFDGSGKPQRFLESYRPYRDVFKARFLNGGAAIVAACGFDGLQVQPLSSKATVAAVYEPLGCLEEVAIDATGQRVLGVNYRHYFLHEPGESGYQLWTQTKGQRLRLAWSVVSGPDHACWGAAYFPNGERFIAVERTGSDSGHWVIQLVVRDSATGEVVDSYPCPYIAVGRMAFSPGGEWLLAEVRMTLAIWSGRDVANGPHLVHNDNRKHFTGIAFHPSGHYLAATSNDHTVKLYDTATWKVARTFTWNVGRLRSVAFSPDGTRAAVGSDKGQIVVWDVDL